MSKFEIFCLARNSFISSKLLNLLTAMTVIQVRDCCDLGKNHGSYIDKKCSYFGYIFKVEPEEFLQLRFGMGGKYDSSYFGLRSGRMELPSADM